MGCSERFFLTFAFVLAAVPAAGQAVDHYDLAPSVIRANGQTIYPAGVNDPSRGNPPAPQPESAIPMPSATMAPVGTTVPGPPVGTPPPSPSVWSPNGPASPSNSAPGPVGSGLWSSPAAVQPQVYSPAVAAAEAGQATQCSWYTRVEYFHWNERANGTNFVNESGPLFTLGYTRQIGIERFRAELFGGSVNYRGYDQIQTSTSEVNIPLTSSTDYLGLRGEYEMVLAPAAWEGRLAFLIGLGSRFWIRGFPDATDDQGNSVPGYRKPGGPYIRISGWKRMNACATGWSSIRNRGPARQP